MDSKKIVDPKDIAKYNRKIYMRIYRAKKKECN